MPSTQRPIVAGVDGSKHSMNALRWAVYEAALRSAPLKLMTWPYEVTASLAYYLVPQGVYARLEKSAEEILDEGLEIAASIAADLGVALTITTQVMTGPVRQGLVEASSSAQMMVVGSRGHGVLLSEIVGSVTSALVQHSHSSVVVVPDGLAPTSAQDRGPVVVGVDGSESSAAATAMAFKEAGLRGTELVAIHGYQSRTPRFEDGFVLSWPEVKTSEELAMSALLAVHRETHPDVATVAKVSAVGAVAALHSASDTAALLVVGTRGRGGFAGLLLGSTSRALLHSVSCPMMIVPAE